MGKNTDKLYVTHSEHSGIDGRHSASSGVTSRKPGAGTQRQLPYIFCALSLQPWEHPVCYIDEQNHATIFDLLVIVPWLQKKGTNPLTGSVLSAKDLLKINFSKNDQDEYCDPITLKVFNDHTHIVAIKQSGNVFAYETIETLNYKAKNWHDLLTDEPFTRADIIQIQDPHNLALPATLNPQHTSEHDALQSSIKQPSKPQDSEDTKAARVAAATKAIEKLRRSDTPTQVIKPSTSTTVKKTSLPYNAANYTTGQTAASLTSTGVSVSTKEDRAILSEVEYLLRPRKVKIKGLAIIRTNHGPIDIELYPEHAPRAVYNFVKLAKSGYYNGVAFHRNIPNFMLQGGDPTGKGNGGKSYYGTEFEDEFHGTRSHDKRGVISMANKGPATNTSQFFITYDAAKHLDNKHTIFGQVIGGDETLDIIERLPRKNDRPIDPITMDEVQILLDPFDEFLKRESKRRVDADQKAGPTEDDLHTWSNKLVKQGKLQRSDGPPSVGKYLSVEPAHEAAQEESDTQHISLARPVKKPKIKGFGDFSGW